MYDKNRSCVCRGKFCGIKYDTGADSRSSETQSYLPRGNNNRRATAVVIKFNPNAVGCIVQNVSSYSQWQRKQRNPRRLADLIKNSHPWNKAALWPEQMSHARVVREAFHFPRIIDIFSERRTLVKIPAKSSVRFPCDPTPTSRRSVHSLRIAATYSSNC